MARGRGDGCCGRGYFCDWGVVGAGSRTGPAGWAKREGVVVAVNFGHPPARCARVPLRGAKGGGYWFTFDVHRHESIFCCVVLSCRDRRTRLLPLESSSALFKGLNSRLRGGFRS